LWLPDLTPTTNMARPQDSQYMGPAQEDQAPAVAQAAPCMSRRFSINRAYFCAVDGLCLKVKICDQNVKVCA